MKKLISEKISSLTRNDSIKVLFAAESGSRAWGFESPDSDYDVRVIYTYPKDHYVQVSLIEQDINLPVDENLIDLSGWELIKAARLVVNNSNASPFEWIQSGIIYGSVAGFKESFTQAIAPYFNPRKMIHHYLGLAKGTFFKHLQGDQIQIKKYFYALRPLLCAEWILKNQSVPPLLFHEVRQINNDPAINEAIDALLQTKETAIEGYLIPIDQVLHHYIEQTMAELILKAKDMRDEKTDTSHMDKFLLEWIR